VAAAFGTAIVMLGLHRLRYLDAAAIVVHFSAVATLVCVGFSIWDWTFRSPFEMKSLAEPTTVLLLAGVAVFACLGQLAMTKAFQWAPPENLSVIGLTQVLFTLGFEAVFWKQEINALKLAGIALVLAPTMGIANYRPVERMTRNPGIDVPLHMRAFPNEGFRVPQPVLTLFAKVGRHASPRDLHLEALFGHAARPADEIDLRPDDRHSIPGQPRRSAILQPRAARI